MNRLPIIYSLFLFVSLTSSVKADTFILNHDTSYFATSNDQLKKYPAIDAIRPALKSFASTAYDSSCNLYEPEWTAIDRVLYLTNIYKCESKNIKADINKLFNVTDGRVKADWVTDTLWLPKGKFVASFDIMQSFYSVERMIVVVKGKITTIKDVNYPVQQNSIYHNGNVDIGYIYHQFNWTAIPETHDQPGKFYISFNSGTTGKPERISIIRGPADTLLRSEIMRVMKDIPWVIVYYHGKVKRISYIIAIVFSEENRMKYSIAKVKE